MHQINPVLPPTRESSPARRCKFWVCLFLCGWYYPRVRVQTCVCVCLICDISPHSNAAVQIRVGLELADKGAWVFLSKDSVPFTRMQWRFVGGGLAAQCEIPPHIAQSPFEIASQRGYRTRFVLFSAGIAQVSLRYPSCVGGGIARQARMLGGGVSRPISSY